MLPSTRRCGSTFVGGFSTTPTPLTGLRFSPARQLSSVAATMTPRGESLTAKSPSWRVPTLRCMTPPPVGRCILPFRRPHVSRRIVGSGWPLSRALQHMRQHPRFAGHNSSTWWDNVCSFVLTTLCSRRTAQHTMAGLFPRAGSAMPCFFQTASQVHDLPALNRQRAGAWVFPPPFMGFSPCKDC